MTVMHLWQMMRLHELSELFMVSTFFLFTYLPNDGYELKENLPVFKLKHPSYSFILKE